jgi:hypothetical protein
VTPQNIVLALLVFALVATRLWEEGLWRAGRISDRTSAILVVGRLPFLFFGFTLFTGQELHVVVGATVLGIVAAAALYPFVVRRLRRLASRPGPTPRPPSPPGSR